MHATHPGWADTPGVAESLPRFHQLTGPLLRDAESGADTTVWMAATAAAATLGPALARPPRPPDPPAPAHAHRRRRAQQMWDWVREQTDVDSAAR